MKSVQILTAAFLIFFSFTADVIGLTNGISAVAMQQIQTPTPIPPPIPNNTSSMTKSKAETVQLRVLGEGFAEATYIIEGDGIAQLSVGDDLIVYSEIVPDVEVQTALLRITTKNPGSVTAQTILEHPQRDIRAGLRVDNNIGELSTSELVPTIEVAVGYILRNGRIRMLPEADLLEDTTLEAMEPEIIDGSIVDYLPFDDPIIVRISRIGLQSVIASAELTSGEWPAPGTIIVPSSETYGEEPSVTATASSELTVTAGFTGFAQPDWDSGWIEESVNETHMTTKLHNLGEYPKLCMVWFSPTNPPNEGIYPHGSCNDNGQVGSEGYQNPLGWKITETDITWYIYKGTNLHKNWDSVQWNRWNTGYFRIFLWK